MVSPVSSSALKQPACRGPSSDLTSICWRLQPLVQKPCILCLSRLFIVLLASIFRRPSSYRTSNPLDGLPLGVGRIPLSLSQRPQPLLLAYLYFSLLFITLQKHPVPRNTQSPHFQKLQRGKQNPRNGFLTMTRPHINI